MQFAEFVSDIHTCLTQNKIKYNVFDQIIIYICIVSKTPFVAYQQM